MAHKVGPLNSVVARELPTSLWTSMYALRIVSIARSIATTSRFVLGLPTSAWAAGTSAYESLTFLRTPLRNIPAHGPNAEVAPNNGRIPPSALLRRKTVSKTEYAVGLSAKADRIQSLRSPGLPAIRASR